MKTLEAAKAVISILYPYARAHVIGRQPQTEEKEGFRDRDIKPLPPLPVLPIAAVPRFPERSDNGHD
jgi:hypothetical protein